jgi:hypothetical protein
MVEHFPAPIEESNYPYWTLMGIQDALIVIQNSCVNATDDLLKLINTIGKIRTASSNAVFAT